MNKHIFKATLVVAFVAVAGYAANNLQKEVEMSDLAVTNVEALAGGEVSVGPFCIVCNQLCFVEHDGFFVRGFRQYF